MVAVAMTFCWIWIGKVATAWPRFQSERRFSRVYFDLWGDYFPPWVVMMGIRNMIFLMRNWLRKWFHASVNRVHLGSILKLNPLGQALPLRSPVNFFVP